jgi:hypothetical protein
MTGQTGDVLFVHRISGIFREADGNRVLPASRFDVGFARTVTRFAPELFLVIFRVSERFTHGGVLEMLTLIRVANYAGIASNVLTAHLVRQVGFDG